MTSTQNDETEEMMTEFLNFIHLNDNLFWHKYDKEKISDFLGNLIQELEAIEPPNDNKP